jgi:hypothetical protein
MRMSRSPGDPEELVGNLDARTVFLMIGCGDYWHTRPFTGVVPFGCSRRVEQDGGNFPERRIDHSTPFMATTPLSGISRR